MGFREPLDLTEIAQDYEAFNPRFHERVVRIGEVNPAYVWEGPPALGEGPDPDRVSLGPIRCSTSRQIATARPTWAWDPNRYYRDLGIPWPHVQATRGDLRVAYLARGGQDSRRLTYCLKQLLNPVVRAEYDALPLGETYLDDEYVQEALRAKAAEEASRRTAAGVFTEARQVLDDWGLKIVEADSQTSLDKEPASSNDQSWYEQTVGAGWRYGFYLWRTTRRDGTTLSMWQAVLIAELSGKCPTLVVGLMGERPEPFAIEVVDGEPVVFLNHRTVVTRALARTAADALTRQMKPMPTDENMKETAAMTTTQQQPTFRKGGDVGDEAAKAARGAGFARIHFFSLEDGHQVVVRYISDSPEWLITDMHASVPTKNKPEGYDGHWPSSMPAVCRYDSAFQGMYSDCYIHDAEIKNKWGKVIGATPREWAFAVLREEVIGTQAMVDSGEIEASQIGKRLGFRDQTREIAERNEKGEETGKTLEELAIVVVNMAPSNFFTGLQSLFSIYRTVTDRDYVVRRVGSGTDTVYNHVPMDPTPHLHGAYVTADGTPVEATERWLERYPPALASQGLDMAAIIASRASDDYYARFFDPTKTAAPRKGEGKADSTTPEVPETPADAVDEDKLATMRARVRGHSGGSTIADVD